MKRMNQLTLVITATAIFATTGIFREASACEACRGLRPVPKIEPAVVVEEDSEPVAKNIAMAHLIVFKTLIAAFADILGD